MTTIHDPVAPQVESLSTRPNLRIVGLHIRGLRAIRSLDLPEDGLGWEDGVPDQMIIGGVNGSGKTTLLEFLAGVFQPLADPVRGRMWKGLPDALAASEAWVDFQIEIPGSMSSVIRFVLGDEAFFERHARGHSYGYKLQEGTYCGLFHDPIVHQLQGWILNREHFAKSSLPGVILIPSQERSFVLPEERYKTPGKIAADAEFVYRWRPPVTWKDSLEARLYSARWEDLNAKEEGRLHDAHHFDAYSRAFDRFFEGAKRLKWEHAELVVELRDGTQHDLSKLSSGEEQVIVLMAELLRHWRPGSLVLIDEPELHLHTYWQALLWDALSSWQAERGGQVIVATQSTDLFEITDPGNKVLLSGKHL
jgi:ABC-type transport system involved in cytochrome c biogenesis ATPase subunit